jgi:hypothetical protein
VVAVPEHAGEPTRDPARGRVAQASSPAEARPEAWHPLIGLQQAVGNRAVVSLVQRTADSAVDVRGPATAEEVAGDVTPRGEYQEPVRLSYAFFFTGGGYGVSARRFFEVHYPEHRRVSAASFEEMFDRLYRDVQGQLRTGQRVHIDELVIVTHANSSGGLQIPLARDDVGRRRNFTPWDLAELQQEFRDRTHNAWRRRQRFRERRRIVVGEAIDENTRVVIRGCEFGQAQDGLDALRAFFGGQPYVWAPRGFQGYEAVQIGRGHLESPQQAFDLLVQQGLVPEDLELTDEEKARFVSELLGVRGTVPTQFFVMDRDAYAALSGEIRAGRGRSAADEEHKERQGTDLPSLGEHWGLSAPPALGEDAELDALSLDEIERRARLLRENYRPEHAPMLQRLRAAWERHPDQLGRLLADDSGDPLAGLPPIEIFGDSNSIAMDAARFERHRQPDAFEAADLPFPTPDEVAQQEAGAYDEGLGTTDDEEASEEDFETPEARARSSAPAGRSRRGRGSAGDGRGAAGPGAAERLRQARGFDKAPRPPRSPGPPPEPRVPPNLDALAQGAVRDELLRSILQSLPDDGWKLSDTLSVVDLSIGVATAPAMFIEGGALIFAWEAAGLLAPLVSLAGLIVTISEAADAQESGARALGVRLGLEQLLFDAGRGRQPDSDRWMGNVRNSQDMYWQVAAGYPLSPDRVRGFVREGMEAVRRAAVESAAGAERRLRELLQRAGYSDGDVSAAMESSGPVLRRLVSEAIVRAGFEAVHARRRALDARRARR